MIQQAVQQTQSGNGQEVHDAAVLRNAEVDVVFVVHTRQVQIDGRAEFNAQRQTNTICMKLDILAGQCIEAKNIQGKIPEFVIAGNAETIIAPIQRAPIVVGTQNVTVAPVR